MRNSYFFLKNLDYNLYFFKIKDTLNFDRLGQLRKRRKIRVFFTYNKFMGKTVMAEMNTFGV